MVSTPRHSSDAEAALQLEQAERAVRIAAMLDRWALEDVASEPEWDIKDVQPATLGSSNGPVAKRER